ncbi:MAG: acetyl-CoA carboxylase biotin carboxyl carrier protein subunit [Woeseiaceae bacterium]|nr:acetyl-CoA carboxylase biotin carboxyl carrier protein subunit [Woeseiaceae bacterium]|tara:strand:+ start:941 stop:1411 length:471 start_codon:yes stop_codon:yes gene_type:complete
MSENSIFVIDGIEVESGSGAEVRWIDRDFFELIYQGKSFQGEILDRDIENRKLRLKLNHRVFEVRKKFVLDALIAELGLDKVKIKKLKELSSPMPGRILNIQVQVGDHVEVGDPILSLEAMKMENILKSDGEGVVKNVAIEKEQVVDKGQLLIEFE